ncbi:MAG: metallophosphoesterase [Bacteriovoracales bacterium]|nr:metallophosphoesterase [Bacteriovoracales bacterium]
MKYQRKSKIDKTFLVISDLHLGAGVNFNGQKNFLEDFHHDRELVEFLDYYCTGIYKSREVELIINGDFLDFLAVPFVPYFADEFWSESASLDKLKIILSAHQEVFSAMDRFLNQKNKKIVYIIGNHDGELVFKKVRDYFISTLSEMAREHFSFYLDGEYKPVDGVIIKHGHEYEVAHNFDVEKSVIESQDGQKYFIPPWGSYYVTLVCNKFKAERDYINQIHPNRTFFTYGLIFDTLFTVRFLFSTAYYFIMVRFLDFYHNNKSFKDIFKAIVRELQLFQDIEALTESFFQKNKIKALILGHTHTPFFRIYEDGSILANTGSWTKTLNLEFSSNRPEIQLTYCQIELCKKDKNAQSEFEHLDVSLNSWKGYCELPYIDFR